MFKNLGLKIRKNYGVIPLEQSPGVKAETWLLVETDRGRECAFVIPFQKLGTKIEKNITIKKILGLATEADLTKLKELDGAEQKFFIQASENIREKGLPLKIVSADLIFDQRKIIFNYKITDEKKGKKLNIKQIARELGQKLGPYVELRQIGVRGEAKLLCGVGVCGRSLCCLSWLGKGEPITIKMAKEQNLALNITKISGLCGRLMCCLKYELEHYRENYDKIKKMGEILEREEKPRAGEKKSGG